MTLVLAALLGAVVVATLVLNTVDPAASVLVATDVTKLTRPVLLLPPCDEVPVPVTVPMSVVFWGQIAVLRPEETLLTSLARDWEMLEMAELMELAVAPTLLVMEATSLARPPEEEEAMIDEDDWA
jgi:hypothetical protein